MPYIHVSPSCLLGKMIDETCCVIANDINISLTNLIFKITGNTSNNLKKPKSLRNNQKGH